MGSYLNPGNKSFQESIQSSIYVDKSGLISHMNAILNTQQKFICVSRPRRFGKSMAADMLAAYYARGEDSAALFQGLKISKDPSFEAHLNQYDVIKLNMQEFLSITRSADEMLERLKRFLIMELTDHFSNVRYLDATDFIQVMRDVYAATKRPFVILVDEWDCLFREYRDNTQAQRKYLDFLRVWLKDQAYVALAYMTGILPIKKYGTHSALNMFWEYSMTDPGGLTEYFGFTEGEVRALCDRFEMRFEEAKAWYDGYHFRLPQSGPEAKLSMYSPKSVVEAMLRRNFGTYWNRTETYEALKVYIQMNHDGLKDAVIKMLAGGQAPVDISGFTNDMSTFHSADDVLTLLIHLGYLTYDEVERTVSIPNKEVSAEYVTAIKRTEGWDEVVRSVERSRQLLEDLWAMDAQAVAEGVDLAHQEVSILQYNDENALSYTINLAFYAAREYYTVVRELPAGKGFADICLIPRKLHADKPAVVIELKWDRSAKGAIAQIKRRQYVAALADYRGNLLLADINYDRDRKTHECVIEKIE